MEYDYKNALYEDITDYIRESEFCDKIIGERDSERLYEMLWTSDSVTGNGSGSYTFNAWRAGEYLAQNWGLIQDVFEEYGTPDIFSPESIDVSIRCHLLAEVLAQVIEDHNEEIEETGETEEND